MIQTIDPLELTAYADGELSLERRIAVERWLSHNPQAAAQVMADLHLRDELLRAHEAVGTTGSASAEALSLRLGGKLVRGQRVLHARPLIAASLLVTLGWFLHDLPGQLGPETVPYYVTAAVEAHYATELRTQMHFQTQPLGPAAVEMLSRTDIELPALPADWSVADIQLYPSEFGPSIEIAVNTRDRGLLSIFAAHPGEDQVMPPVMRDVDDTTTAYWQSGNTAYVLVAAADTPDLTGAAMSLFRSLTDGR